MSNKVGFTKVRIPWNKGIKGTHFSPATEFKKGVHYSVKTEFKKGHKLGVRFKKGIIPFNVLHPEVNIIGNKHYLWKGDRVGYFALHSWVRRWLGSPTECENCGLKGGKVGRRWNLEWANKSREYKRDLNDWISLCIPCHRKYDGAYRRSLV